MKTALVVLVVAVVVYALLRRLTWPIVVSRTALDEKAHMEHVETNFSASAEGGRRTGEVIVTNARETLRTFDKLAAASTEVQLNLVAMAIVTNEPLHFLDIEPVGRGLLSSFARSALNDLRYQCYMLQMFLFFRLCSHNGIPVESSITALAQASEFYSEYKWAASAKDAADLTAAVIERIEVYEDALTNREGGDAMWDFGSKVGAPAGRDR